MQIQGDYNKPFNMFSYLEKYECLSLLIYISKNIFSKKIFIIILLTPCFKFPKSIRYAADQKVQNTC